MIGLFPKNCGDNIKELEGVDFNKYGKFMCGTVKYFNHKSFEKRHSFDMSLNTGKVLAYVNSYNYSYFGKLRRFILSNKKIECSERPISIWSRDLIELKK